MFIFYADFIFASPVSYYIVSSSICYRYIRHTPIHWCAFATGIIIRRQRCCLIIIIRVYYLFCFGWFLCRDSRVCVCAGLQAAYMYAFAPW